MGLILALLALASSGDVSRSTSAHMDVASDWFCHLPPGHYMESPDPACRVLEAGSTASAASRAHAELMLGLRHVEAFQEKRVEADAEARMAAATSHRSETAYDAGVLNGVDHWQASVRKSFFAQAEAVAAVTWIRRSASHGNMSAECHMAMLYEEGLVVPKNYSEAMRHATLSASAKEGGCERFLALLYSRGEGAPRDYGRLVALYHADLAKGAQSEEELGELYDDGLGVPLNHSEAARLYQVVVDRAKPDDVNSRYPEAARRLGHLYAHGIGVTGDRAKAWMLLELGLDRSKRGDAKADRAFADMDALGPIMSQADLSRAADMLRQWHVDHPRTMLAL